MTVRQVFYQATVAGIVEKSEAGYNKVQTDLVQMRKAGSLPYSLARRQHPLAAQAATPSTASSRPCRTPRGSIASRSGPTPTATSRSGWRRTPWPASSTPSPTMYDVPLMVARGYASLSFLHSAAEYISDLDVPTYIYHLGDFDPSGVNAGEKIEQTLRELAPDAEIHFERVAVTPEPDQRMGSADAADEDDRQPVQELRRHLGRAGRDPAGPAAGACSVRHARACARSLENHVRMRHASRPPHRLDAGRLARATWSHIGDAPLRRHLQGNGCAGRRFRLKIQAGCRPHGTPSPSRTMPVRYGAPQQADWFRMGSAFFAFKETCRNVWRNLTQPISELLTWM